MFIGMMISVVLVMVAGLFAIGLAGNAIWRAVMPPSGLPRNAGCGSCGYELTTLAAGRCSECGADLLKAGVTTRRNAVRLAGSLPAALTGWTLLVMGATLVVLYTVSIVTLTSSTRSMMNSYSASYTYRPALTGAGGGASGSTPSFRVQLDLDVEGSRAGRPTSGELMLGLSANASVATFRFDDVSTDDWVLTDDAGAMVATGTVLASDDVLAAFRAVGLDPDTDASLHGFADRIEELAAEALQNPMRFSTSLMIVATQLPAGTPRLDQVSGTSGFGAGATPFGTMNPSDAIIPAVTLGVACGVWLAGSVFIVRRRAKLIEGPRPTPSV